MTLMVLAALGAGAAYYFGTTLYAAPGPLQKRATYMVEKGAGVAQIAQGLENEGIVSNARFFQLASRIYLKGDTLKAGEYAFAPHVSMETVLDILRSGRSILHSITFPEGLTVKAMFEKLEADQYLSGDLPDDRPEEGSLMPDTYKFTRGTPRKEIVEKMHKIDDRVVDRIWANRDPNLPLDSKAELVTLASIVEKETGQPGERPKVAAVFMNRLKKGMRLQSDPTVIYGIFGGDGKPSGRPLYESDLKKTTRYNTYRIDGLPPTPIANPGRKSLEAVAHPADTDALYFVADGTGGHVFSESLKEHNANVRRWRAIQASRKDAADTDTDTDTDANAVVDPDTAGGKKN
ncbi:endolytic transglycosylase MltG [Pararhizobium mangrovi]|uniref:Endolytic murein transglycosylase n=2 Tax=Pararhizobium mangrovi TaxID=2590452 RepID=A0A506UFM0_9HYPH|nr:endolytic transglycosylase MltG [Pararhizobium mangrovi]